jgi:hypothetical protein
MKIFIICCLLFIHVNMCIFIRGFRVSVWVLGIRGFGFVMDFHPKRFSGFDFGFWFWVHGDSTRSEPDLLPSLGSAVVTGSLPPTWATEGTGRRRGARPPLTGATACMHAPAADGTRTRTQSRTRSCGMAWHVDRPTCVRRDRARPSRTVLLAGTPCSCA